MNAKVGLYIVAGYLVVLGIAELVSNTADTSPVADTISQLPSPGSMFGGDSAGKIAFFNFALAAGGLLVLPKYAKAFR